MGVERGRKKKLIYQGSRFSSVCFPREIVTAIGILPLLLLLFINEKLVCDVSLDKNSWWYVTQTALIRLVTALKVIYKVFWLGLWGGLVANRLDHAVEGLEKTDEAWTFLVSFLFLVTSQTEWLLGWIIVRLILIRSTLLLHLAGVDPVLHWSW